MIVSAPITSTHRSSSSLHHHHQVTVLCNASIHLHMPPLTALSDHSLHSLDVAQFVHLVHRLSTVTVPMLRHLNHHAVHSTYIGYPNTVRFRCISNAYRSSWAQSAILLTHLPLISILHPIQPGTHYSSIIPRNAVPVP